MRPLLLVLLLVSAPAFAEEVELELVLLADTSGSINTPEVRFQRQGYAEAMTDPAVIAAIRGTFDGRIAVTYVEWGAADSQAQVVPWAVIDGPESAGAFAEALLPPPRMAFGRNAIGSALLFGKRLIEENGIDGRRGILDLSADRLNNWDGPPIAEAREAVLAAGITINGLAVLCRRCTSVPLRSGALERGFEERIIGGPGAFVVTADGSESFAESVRRKLILEISGLAGAPSLALLERAASPLR
ncbi:MAG: DUF1194 domain-containing protein [Paracoccaceae bacterium]|nr:DUF1194 domain-containing protein [Paracoccaceae bacterium]